LSDPAASAEDEPTVSAEDIVSELRGRVRERLRSQLRGQGAAPALDDPALFAEVESLLQSAAATGPSDVLLLPELLGDPETWRLQTAMRYESHRGAGAASFIVFIKRRVLMPVFRWLFEYSRDNFERQRRVNQVLFACVQELAVENARLRQEFARRAGGPGPAGPAR
jgi:hypothetical protein